MSQSPVPPDEPTPTRFRRSVPAARGARTALVLTIVVLAFGGLGWYVATTPRLVFTNQLAGSVRLTADQKTPVTLRPGKDARLTAPRDRAMVVAWELVRPLSASGEPMGSEIRGSVVMQGSSGTVKRTALARGTDADYFAPLISNATPDLLRVTVNAGLEGSLDCGCAVRPGARRVFIGYYPLFQNSTVRATNPRGRSAMFRDLGPTITARDGTVGLRFETRDLR
jgi:hypothetical protein